VCILCGNYVNLLVDGMYVVALAHATNTMSGATFHSLAMMLVISGWYFVVLFIDG
jgi:hypothetical protein